MNNKKQCLSNFLEIPVERISPESMGSDEKFRFEDKVYWILTGEEAYDEFYDYVNENLYRMVGVRGESNKGVLPNYLTISSEVDRDLFFEILQEAVDELQEESDVLIRAHIPNFQDFVQRIAEKEFHNDYSSVLAVDGKQHFSREFHYYIYRIE